MHQETVGRGAVIRIGATLAALACLGQGETRDVASESHLLKEQLPAEATDSASFTVLSTRTLDADGPARGLGAYALIRAFAGPKAIEAPDLYGVNHPGVAHIYEATDELIGPHFVFVIHRDRDRDRDRLKNDDRQRNEIKGYDKSARSLKGFGGDTFVYRWKFKVNQSMAFSKRFSHLFQLKAVGGEDRQPIITITGAKRRGEDGIEVRHSPGVGGTVLARQPTTLIAGEWLHAYCRATFAEAGELRLIVTRVRDGAVVFDITEAALDLWRGNAPDHFVRPKWGIYRSVADRENLRPEEESVRFANFSVNRIALEGAP